MTNRSRIYLQLSVALFIGAAVAVNLRCSPKTGGRMEDREPGKMPKMTPPAAEKIARLDTLHGEVRADDYFWLRERENPKVIEYLKAENEYTDAMMKHTEAFQEKLYQEILSRIKETDLSVPERLDDYYYYSRTEEGKQYRIYCRKRESLEAEEEIILDVNELAEGHKFMRLGVFEVSPNHKLLAFSTDTAGGERYTIHVKDLTTGELLEDEISNSYYSLEWANDNETFFYNTLDEAHRPYMLHRHRLGADPKEDALVYHEEDEAFFLGVSKTKSKEFLILNMGSAVTSEVWYADANDPTDDFKVIHPRQHEMEYSVSHHGDRFFIVTNDEAVNFKLMEAPVDDPSKDNWKEVIPHRDSVKVDYADVFRNHLVVYEREKGLRRIRVEHLSKGQVHYVEFPEPVYTFWAGRNRDFTTNELRFTYTSLVTPRSVYDYHMDEMTRELKKEYEVLGGYDKTLYQSERVFAQASDGTDVPISLVYKKGMVRDGSSPMLLYGYGSYGASIDPSFDSNRLSLLDRGFIYAIAHVRGGGEMGRQWYEDGKMDRKRNTFTDFIACAEHLVAEGYTSTDRLAIRGGSAGGLLMGTVTNMRPDLFKVVVAKVPFVDVVNTMLDASIPLTVIEWEEWGNPNLKDNYEYIRSYSPYDNVQRTDYPNMLVTTGLNDPRVAYWEPAKWVAKLRALKSDDKFLILKTNMGAGHGGKSGRYEKLRELAFEYAFVFDRLGITE